MEVETPVETFEGYGSADSAMWIRMLDIDKRKKEDQRR
jgi:hypothetical protein